MIWSGSSRCAAALALLLSLSAAWPAAALTPNLRIESNQNGALFGGAMANAGDVNGDGIDDLIVGATDWDENGGDPENGAVFLFHGRPGGFTTGDVSQADTKITISQDRARIGTAVGSAGDVNGDGFGDVIVGAGGWDGGQVDEGAAFIFHGGPGGIPSGDASTAQTTLQGDWVNARLGTSVGHADINGDGYDDVIVGGRLFQNDVNVTQEGYALLFLGGPTGVASAGRLTAHAMIEANGVGATMGEAVAGVGDVNDDGYEDVLIGAPRWNGGLIREGGAFLYLGSPTGIPSGDASTADAVLEGQQVDARFGRALTGLGDINGDGYDDVAIAATQYDAGQTDEGAVFVFLGSADGLVGAGPVVGPSDAVAVFEGGQTDVHPTDREYFGFGLGVGDWDDDGYTDLLISSPYHDGALDAEGAAFLFRGGADGFTSASAEDADRKFFSGVAQGWAGASAALVDVDGDGLAEAFLGANRFGNPIPAEQSEGMVLGFPRVGPCENGVDDDGDLAVDLSDAGCASFDDMREEIDFSNGALNAITNERTDTLLARDRPSGTPTTVSLGAGGSTTRDLVSIENSVVRLTGGSVAGDLVANDSGRAEITSGTVGGTVRAFGASLVTIRGGTVVAIEARDTARIELYGLDFELPNGDVAAFSGTISGTLEDGSPIDATFERDALATIHLVPEPGGAALAGAAALALAALRRRR